MNSMDAYDAYKIYLGLKLHFTTEDYDFVRYNGKTSSTKNAFLKRKDRHFFSKVARKHGESTKDYFISNFLSTPKGWLGEFTEENFTQWKKKTQSLRYNYEQDLLFLMDQVDEFDEIFVCKNGQHPLLLKQYLSKRVSIETMVILETLLGYCRRFDKEITEDIIWPKHRLLIQKYKSLLTVNPQEYKLKTLSTIGS